MRREIGATHPVNSRSPHMEVQCAGMRVTPRNKMTPRRTAISTKAARAILAEEVFGGSAQRFAAGVIAVVASTARSVVGMEHHTFCGRDCSVNRSSVDRQIFC